MRGAWTGALCAVAALAAASVLTPARAEETRPPATAQAGAAPAAQVQVRVRASHRVDVIAPGENVETVLDRMRAGRAASPPGEARAGAGGAPGVPGVPVRSPDRRAAGDRGAGPGNGPMPAGGSVTGGGLPMGMPRGDGLPSDRRHR